MMLINISYNDWYDKPLDYNDILAGGSLISFAIIFLSLYILIISVLLRKNRVIVGFRYLLSASFADILLIINYALWPGTIILLKVRLPLSGRRTLQIYIDWIWFTVCYHFPLIAWSRLAAVYRPYQYRVQKITSTYALCSLCYVAGLIQSVVVHFQPWYITFYYEPSAYGFLPEDLQSYLEGGQSLFFLCFHFAIIVCTLVQYSCAILLLFKHNRNSRRIPFKLPKHPTTGQTSVHVLNSGMPIFIGSSMRAETRLILPCICNAVVFIIGQIVITTGTGEGRWASWLVLMLFSCSAAVEPVLLIVFSRNIRQDTLLMLDKLFYDNKATVRFIKSSKSTDLHHTGVGLRLSMPSKHLKPYNGISDYAYSMQMVPRR